MKIKPAPGLKVRDPELKDFLPAEGREVASSMHWHRLLRDGDVLEVTDDDASAAAAAEGGAQ